MRWISHEQRKFIDWKKTKLFGFRWNWDEEKKLSGIRLQISSLPPICLWQLTDNGAPSVLGGGGQDLVDTMYYCRWCTLSCEYFHKFLKNLKRPNGILRGLGHTDSWKKLNRQSCGTVPLNFLLNVQNWKPQIFSLAFLSNYIVEAIFHDCEST